MKFTLRSLDEVSEAFRGEYELRDGVYHLKTEGDYAPLVDSERKLTEFRNNNRALNTQKTELETKLAAFKDIDPAKHAELVTKIAALEKKGIKGDGDVATLIQDAVKAAVGPIQQKLQEREASEAAAKTALAEQALENSLREVGVKVGIADGAMRDYVGRGKEVFKLVDGAPAARRGDAPIFSPTKPTEVLTMEEWANTSLKTDAPHLFKPSKGGGGGGNGNGGGGGPVVRRVIDADPLEFGRNLESIAKGETTVNMSS
jgi:hypothetical protein